MVGVAFEVITYDVVEAGLAAPAGLVQLLVIHCFGHLMHILVHVD